MEVNTNSVSPIHVILFDSHNSAYAQIAQTYIWFHSDFPNFFFVVVNSLNDVIESFNLCFILNFDCFKFFNLFVVCFDHLGQFDVILELQKRSSDDIFRVHIFEPLTIDHHVHIDVETRQKIVTVTLKHILRYIRLHFFVNHENCDSFFIESSSACPSTHLNVLSATHPSELLPIEFTNWSENNCFSWHVQSHRKCFCWKKAFQQAFLEKNLNDLFHQRQ